jgi:hypothetical protein
VLTYSSFFFLPILRGALQARALAAHFKKKQAAAEGFNAT